MNWQTTYNVLDRLVSQIAQTSGLCVLTAGSFDYRPVFWSFFLVKCHLKHYSYSLNIIFTVHRDLFRLKFVLKTVFFWYYGRHNLKKVFNLLNQFSNLNPIKNSSSLKNLSCRIEYINQIYVNTLR